MSSPVLQTMSFAICPSSIMDVRDNYIPEIASRAFENSTAIYTLCAPPSNHRSRCVFLLH
eukprot:m.34139 g.34139  ORF g.34139 m.34139 type:complete len:60 (-) comp5649_c0_seq2:3-182(-)